MLKNNSVIIVLLFLLSCFVVNAQQNSFVIDRREAPLDIILDDLRQNTQVELSFNSTELSNYSISLTDTFLTVDAALDTLLYGLPFIYEKIGSVYLISSFQALSNFSKNDQLLLLNGFIKDKSTGEFLPYCTVYINDQLRITDARGRFSFIALSSEKLHFSVQFLGFETVDTTIIAQPEFSCEMMPKSMDLNETVVNGKHVEYGLLAGDEVGVTRLNQKLLASVAGNKNNAVYNLLRLQPGILAASEQGYGLSMWGSYAGQNQVLFDGITVFNITGNNPFVSIINPFVIKDILISKGGMGAQYGDRVGGVVEITGIDGNYRKPEVKLMLDNMMVNGLYTTPVKSRNALMISFRQTWFQSAMQSMLNDASSSYSAENTLSVAPNYAFRDLHLKYTGNPQNGDQFFISAYNSAAKSSYNISDKLLLNSSQDQFQNGISAFYGTTWFNGVNSSFKINYSAFSDENTVDSTWRGDVTRMQHGSRNNSINEVKASFDNRFAISRMQFVELGLTSQFYASDYNFHQGDISMIDDKNKLFKVGGYVRNHISANDVLTMDIGLRLDYSPNPNTMFFQPRIKSSVKVTDYISINMGLGIYNQYISQVPVIDDNGNYTHVWDLSNRNDRPALQTDMASAGLSYNGDGWLLNSEFFYKRTTGLTRYLTQQNSITSYAGNSKSIGLDMMVKRDFRKHSAWLSYSTGKTEEYFDYFTEVVYKPAIFNQNYEIKGATFFNFNPLFLSASYVYGSGLPQSDYLFVDFGAYQRIDATLTYKMVVANSKVDMGVSVQNIFNRQNRSATSTTLLSSQSTNYLAVTTADIPRYFTIFVFLSF